MIAPESNFTRVGGTMENVVRILIVEDHEATRETLTLLFQREGFLVSSARTVREASEVFHRDPPTVAVVDIGLPDGSGLDLVEEFVAKDPNTRVIVVTARDGEHLAREAKKRGAFSFIQKPYGFRDLLAAVNEALKKT
jgi:two-component system, NtrC family, response regulator AtoC